MFNEIIAVVVSAFQKPGSEADKNGLQNVYLTPIAGKIPNQAMVVSGTVAQKAGLVVGSTLMVMVTERQSDPVYGRQFSHTVLGEVKPTDILNLRKELGAAVVIDTTTNNANSAENAPAAPSLNTSGLPNGKKEETEELVETEESAPKLVPQQPAGAKKN